MRHLMLIKLGRSYEIDVMQCGSDLTHIRFTSHHLTFASAEKLCPYYVTCVPSSLWNMMTWLLPLPIHFSCVDQILVGLDWATLYPVGTRKSAQIRFLYNSFS